MTNEDANTKALSTIATKIRSRHFSWDSLMSSLIRPCVDLCIKSWNLTHACWAAKMIINSYFSSDFLHYRPGLYSLQHGLILPLYLVNYLHREIWCRTDCTVMWFDERLGRIATTTPVNIQRQFETRISRFWGFVRSSRISAQTLHSIWDMGSASFSTLYLALTAMLWLFPCFVGPHN